jgi:hypothetical protein
MTDTNLGDTSASAASTATPVSTPASAPAQPAPVRTFTQDEVNEIVGRNKREAYEHGKRDAIGVNQPATQTQPIQSQAATQNIQPTQIGGVNQITPEQIQRMIDERAPQAFAQQLQQQQTLNTRYQYIQKLEAGKSEYPEFDQKVAALNLPQHEELIPLLNSVDQSVAAGVIYDMAENPRKFAELKVLNMMNPHLAALELNKLAESIRQNKAASNVKSPNEPLNQVKTSVTGADNGQLTVAEIRRKAMYRV